MYNRIAKSCAVGLALVVAASLVAGPAGAGVVVIANPSVKATQVTGDELQNLFLGKTTTWGDGAAAKPAVLAEGDVLEEFLKTYIKKTSAQFGTFWKKAVFSGTGSPPAEFKTEAELVAYVAKTPGAIGFVADGTDVAGAKKLAAQ